MIVSHGPQLLTPSDAANMDIEGKTAAIKTGWHAFVEADLPLLAAAVIEIVNSDQTARTANLTLGFSDST
jgi:hypothetical protein